MLRRRIDAKYHIEVRERLDGEERPEIVKTATGVAIPDWEPLFLLRARDRLALPLLHKYLSLCEEDRCTQEQIQALIGVIAGFSDFFVGYNHLMKQPGITMREDGEHMREERMQGERTDEKSTDEKSAGGESTDSSGRRQSEGISAVHALPVEEAVRNLIHDLGGEVVDGPVVLPDDSGFITASFPLPKSHWLTQPGQNVPPIPLLQGTNHPGRQWWSEALRAAGKYALRCATMNGTEVDLDPDALLQNLVVGFLGYNTPSGLFDEEEFNPRQPYSQEHGQPVGLWPEPASAPEPDPPEVSHAPMGLPDFPFPVPSELELLYVLLMHGTAQLIARMEEAPIGLRYLSQIMDYCRLILEKLNENSDSKSQPESQATGVDTKDVDQREEFDECS